MPTGTVKWFSSAMRYGFIKPDDGGTFVFVHANAVEGERGSLPLAKGDAVSFEVEIDEYTGRSEAVRVKKL